MILSLTDDFIATGCITFASNMVLAADTKVSENTSRGIAAAAMVFVGLMHGLTPKIGVKAMNVVGVLKLGIVLFIVVTGWVALGLALVLRTLIQASEMLSKARPEPATLTSQLCTKF